MKSSTNNTQKTVTATETVAGEASKFTLVVKSKSGAVILRRPLLEPVPEPVPPLPPPPDPTPAPTPTPPPPTTGVAELPRAVPPSVLTPIGGMIRKASTAGEILPAIAAARPGDTVAIAPGVVYAGGQIVLPQPPGTVDAPVIELRTDIPRTPFDAASRRMRPSLAASLNLAKLVTTDNQPVIRTVNLENPTRGWVLSDLELTTTYPKTSLQYGLLALGDGGWLGGGETQISLARVPSGFLVDRCYIHGSDASAVVRGVALNSAMTAITSSYISGIHAGVDSQAVCGWNGPGPYLFADCTFEAAGENVMVGGAVPGITDLAPADITILGCHFPTPLSWTAEWSVKNPFELKTARRVLVEACVFDNSPIDSQSGMLCVLKSAPGGGGSYPAVGTMDVTMRYNRFRNGHRGLNLQGYDNSYGDIGFEHLKRIAISHNLFEGVGTVGSTPPFDGWLMLLTHDLRDIEITHNTFVGNTQGLGLACYFAYPDGGANVRITDNVFAGQQLAGSTPGYIAIQMDGGLLGTAALNAFAGSWAFVGNVVAQVGAEYAGMHPSGNFYVDQVAKIGLAPDYSLGATSPFKGKATDGTDPGANVAKVLARTAGVVVAP